MRVGGAMRGEASHDADFVVWHPTKCAAPLPGALAMLAVVVCHTGSAEL